MGLYGRLQFLMQPIGGDSLRVTGTLCRVGRYGALWVPKGRCGAPCGAVGRYGALWVPMGRCGALCGAMGPYGALWGAMGRCGVL